MGQRGLSEIVWVKKEGLEHSWSISKVKGVFKTAGSVAVEFKNFSVQGILKNLSFPVYRNSVTSIIGPSGSGKTTLLRSINQIVKHRRPQSGSILLEGVDIWSIKPIEVLRTRVGMIFQTPVLLPMSIKENVLFGLTAHGLSDPVEKRKALESCLKNAGVWEEVKDNLDSSGDNLSMGQKQRVCIARTISLKPEILLMDEPTSALDPVSSTAVEQLILALSQNYTIILVSHSLSQVRRLSNHTVFLKNGMVVEYGETRKMFTNPLQKETRDFVSKGHV